MSIGSKEELQEILEALGEALELEGGELVELLVCGGAGLLYLESVSRVTKDVDVVALVEDGGDKDPKPFPEHLKAAILRVSRDFQLQEDWLNYGPRESQVLGLPQGIVERAHTQTYGSLLSVHFLSRLDQIFFKFYALVDHSGPGKHMDDLQKLTPTAKEIKEALEWTRTHDPSEGFQMMAELTLQALGFAEVLDDSEA